MIDDSKNTNPSDIGSVTTAGDTGDTYSGSLADLPSSLIPPPPPPSKK